MTTFRPIGNWSPEGGSHITCKVVGSWSTSVQLGKVQKAALPILPGRVGTVTSPGQVITGFEFADGETFTMMSHVSTAP